MSHFGTTTGGTNVQAIIIAAGEISVTVLTYGAIVQDVRLAGVEHGLALGSDALSDYENSMGYFGAIVGPIANRISNARVRLDGMMYELERNEAGRTHLHSGQQGVHRQVWDVSAQSETSVTLQLRMADGMAGLPGNRVISVTYEVNAPATLTMTMNGTTDAKTCMNFASHIYWNLGGTDTWEGHKLRIAADHYLPVDNMTCPTGEVVEVSGTTMDFRKTQMPNPGAPVLDHNFCLSDAPTGLRDVLWLTAATGLEMTVATTEPGMQIHDACGLARPGQSLYEGLVIEPQRWPDAPNHPHFPSIAVTPDAPYHQQTQWRFKR